MLKAGDKLLDLFDLVATIRIDKDGFNRGLDEAKSEVQSFSDGLKSTGQAISNVGTSLTQKVSNPLLNIGKSMLQAGMDYEAGMDEVSAISGATGTQINALGDKAMEMAAKTKFSTAESAEAYKYMAMAGWKTNDMLNSLDAVMYLAGASGESLGTTSDIVTDAMTAFGMAADKTSKVLKNGVEVEVSNATRFTDVLAAASNNANTNVSMMGESFKYVAPVAGAMKYSIEDTAIALGLMANSGVKASMSGTSLRSVLTNLSDPTDSMSSAMDKLGISLTDEFGNMHSLKTVMDLLRRSFQGANLDMGSYNLTLERYNQYLDEGTFTQDQYNDAVERLAIHTFGLADAEKAKYAATLAGKYGMAGLLSIVTATEEDYNKLTEAIYNSNGATEEMYNVMTDNAQGAVTMLDSAINVLFTSMSQHIIPIFTEVVRTITDVVNWFGSLDESTQKLILTIGGIAIAAGPVITGVGKVITAIGTIGGAVSGVVGFVTDGISSIMSIGGSLMGGIQSLFGLIMAHPIAAVVTAIIAAVMLLWQNCEEFRNAVGAIWEAITGFFTGAAETIKAAWNGVTEFFASVWQGIQSVFSTVAEVLGGFFQAAAEAVQSAWSAVVDFFTGVWERIQGIFSTLAEAIGGFFSAAWDTVQSVWSAASEFFSGIADGIHSVFDEVTQFLGKAFRSAWEAVKNAWDKAVAFFSNIWSSIKRAASEAAESVGNAFRKAWNSVKSAWKGTTEFFGGIFKKIVGVFSNIGNRFKEIGSNIVNGLKNGILGAWKSFTGFVNGKINGIITSVKEKLGIHSPSKVFAGIGENMALGLAKGWDNQYTNTKNQIERGLVFSSNFDLSGNGAAAYGSVAAQNRQYDGKGVPYAGELQPVTIVVQSVFDKKVIGEATYQYALNRERAYGGR